MATANSTPRSSGAAIVASAATILAAASTQADGTPGVVLVVASVVITLGAMVLLASNYTE